MQNIQALGQNGKNIRQVPDANLPTTITPTVKEIPYDYVARFTLQGNNRGNRVPDVINISTDGAFVAVTIGYSFIPAPLPDLTQAENTGTTNRKVFLARRILGRNARIQSVNDVIGDPRALLQCLMVRYCGIDFKYSIIDSGTGRELQNLSIHNIAGLGEATGERPFRQFAKPMLFMPRSTIRIVIEEVSVGPLYVGAELSLVLHGYKMLGYGI